MIKGKLYGLILQKGNPPPCLKSFQQCRGCFGWRNMIQGSLVHEAWQNNPIKCSLTGLTLKMDRLVQAKEKQTNHQRSASFLLERAPLTYYKPQTLPDAVKLLSKYETDACLISGGTDLLPLRQSGKNRLQTSHLIDISALGLSYIRKTDKDFCVGAATPVNDLIQFPEFATSPYAALIEAAKSHSTATIRNRATIGGNIVNASLCADLVPPLMALNASLVIASSRGERFIPVEFFIEGPNCSALKPDEMLIEILIPIETNSSVSGFLKLGRNQTRIDMAVVNIATRLFFRDKKCIDARIVIGAAGPRAFRAKTAETVIKKGQLNEETIHQAASAAMAESSPIDDMRASAAYRKKMVAYLVKESMNIIRERSIA